MNEMKRYIGKTLIICRANTLNLENLSEMPAQDPRPDRVRGAGGKVCGQAKRPPVYKSSTIDNDGRRMVTWAHQNKMPKILQSDVSINLPTDGKKNIAISMALVPMYITTATIYWGRHCLPNWLQSSSAEQNESCLDLA